VESDPKKRQEEVFRARIVANYREAKRRKVEQEKNALDETIHYL